MPRLSPELRAVFRLARPALDGDHGRAMLREVGQWGRLLVLAEAEGAVPTLWRTLRPMAAELPAQAVTFLQARSALQDFRMSRLAVRTADVVAQLRAREIPVLLLKGSAIGAYCDPSFRSRPMSDVDLLVHARDLPAADAAIAAAGWRRTDDQRLHELLQGMHHEAPFLDPQLPGVRLELHTALFPPDHSFDLPVAAMWESAHAAPTPFEGALLPAPELLALHAAIHYAWQHQMTFGTWRTLRGIALLAARPGFDWSRLVQEARSRRATSSLHWTLRIGVALDALDVPRDVLEATRPPTPAFIGAAIERHVIGSIAPGEYPVAPAQRVARWLWLAAIRPGWSGHARAGRHDPEHRWDRAMGTYNAESATQKLSRHTKSYRRWAEFVARTIFGR
jgi:hypothetical protein